MGRHRCCRRSGGRRRPRQHRGRRRSGGGIGRRDRSGSRSSAKDDVGTVARCVACAARLSRPAIRSTCGAVCLETAALGELSSRVPDDAARRTRPPSKGLKQTRLERIGAAHFGPSVRRTASDCRSAFSPPFRLRWRSSPVRDWRPPDNLGAQRRRAPGASHPGSGRCAVATPCDTRPRWWLVVFIGVLPVPDIMQTIASVVRNAGVVLMGWHVTRGLGRRRQ